MGERGEWECGNGNVTHLLTGELAEDGGKVVGIATEAGLDLILH